MLMCRAWSSNWQTIFLLAPAGYTGDVCHIREQLMSVTGINRELLITDLLLRIEHYLQPGVVLPVPHL